MGDKVAKFWFLYKSMVQFCQDHGYHVYLNVFETVEEFKKAFPTWQSILIIADHNDDPTDRIVVFFPPLDIMDVQDVEIYCSIMLEHKFPRAVFVLRTGMTPAAKQYARDMASQVILEQVLESELLANNIARLKL